MPPLNRTAIVTGAGRGLGAAVAAKLAADGVSVITLDVAGAVDHEIDVTDPEALDRIARTSGPVDILVNAAGIIGPNIPLLDTTPEQWRQVFEVNVVGTVNAMRAFMPGMAD